MNYWIVVLISLGCALAVVGMQFAILIWRGSKPSADEEYRAEMQERYMHANLRNNEKVADYQERQAAALERIADCLELAMAQGVKP